MPKVLFSLAVFLLFPNFLLEAQTESFRTTVDGVFEVTPERLAGNTANIGINNSVIINLGGELRFLKGIEIELVAPQNWLQYRSSLVMLMYNNLSLQTASGITDLTGSRIAFDPLPSRLRIIYQIPIRTAHGLRTSTSIIVPTSIIATATFPIMFRLMQVSKGLPDEFENMTLSLIARPILSDEGAVRLVTRFPPQLRNRPFTVLINDEVVNNISEQIFLREGEHHLVIRSDDYRNESRRFFVEKARVVDLILELQDPTPIITFEAPQNAQILFNNTLITNLLEPIAVEPGIHEIKYQIGNYTITRAINIQRGKNYRIALAVDLTIQEEE